MFTQRAIPTSWQSRAEYLWCSRGWWGMGYGSDRPGLFSWVPRSPASNLSSDFNSEFQMPHLCNADNRCTSQCCRGWGKVMGIKHIAWSLALEGDLIYNHWKKIKEKNLTALIAPPWPLSQSPKMCWRLERQRVLNLVAFKNTQRF